MLANRAAGLPNKKGSLASPVCGAGDESRTRDLNLGKVALYQLSYSRMVLLNNVLLLLLQHRLYNTLPAKRCFKIWSGRRVSNSRPQPWQGCALPTELLPRFATCL